MKNQFADRIYFLERELLDLKTASEFTSTRSVNLKSTGLISTGLYEVTYGDGNAPIFTMVYAGMDTYNWITPRTPIGNTQIIEVNTTRWNNDTQSYETFNNRLVVVSNRPIISIEKIY